MDCKLEIRQQEGEGFTGTNLCCSTTYKRNKYSTILNTDEDYVRCQKPEQVLLPKFCAKQIMTDKNYATRFNERDNLIEVIWLINTDTSIVLTLHCMPKKTPTIEELLARIEELEQTKDGYEIVFSHTYPKWSSFAEFEKLDGYKYFQAVDNPAQFDRLIPEDSVRKSYYIYKEDGIYFTFANNRTLYTPGDIGEWAGVCFMERPLCGYKHIGDARLMDELVKIYDKDRKALSMADKYKRSGDIDCFIGKELPMYLAAYFNEYLYGWALLNPTICINHALSYEIDINSGKSISIVLKKKITKQRMNLQYNTISKYYTCVYQFPSNPTFIIDGIKY